MTDCYTGSFAPSYRQKRLDEHAGGSRSRCEAEEKSSGQQERCPVRSPPFARDGAGDPGIRHGGNAMFRPIFFFLPILVSIAAGCLPSQSTLFSSWRDTNTAL